jgi:hypothetical protein
MELVNFVPSHAMALSKMGLEPPFYLFISLIDMKNIRLSVEWCRNVSDSIDRADVLLPEIVIDTLPVNSPGILRAPLEMLWNAAGHDYCPYFANGKWWKT